MLRRLVVALLIAGAAPVAAAAADGGPSPGVDQGSYGLLSAAGNVRYVTLSGPHSTTLEAIRTGDGHVLRWRSIPGASSWCHTSASLPSRSPGPGGGRGLAR